jgi:hypothetical protein
MEKLFHLRPPLLSFGMRRHLAPITFQVASVVFEVAEERAVLEECRSWKILSSRDKARWNLSMYPLL